MTPEQRARVEAIFKRNGTLRPPGIYLATGGMCYENQCGHPLAAAAEYIDAYLLRHLCKRCFRISIKYDCGMWEASIMEPSPQRFTCDDRDEAIITVSAAASVVSEPVKPKDEARELVRELRSLRNGSNHRPASDIYADADAYLARTEPKP